MIGERLLDLRKDVGLTQNQLGEIINVNKHSISSYERDKSEPPDEIKIRIAKYFAVSVDYLLGVTDSPNPYATSTKFPAMRFYSSGFRCIRIGTNMRSNGIHVIITIFYI